MDLRLIVEGLDNSTNPGVKLSPALSPVSTHEEMKLEKPLRNATETTKSPTNLNISTGNVAVQHNSKETQPPDQPPTPIRCGTSNGLPDRYSHPKHSNPPSVVRSRKTKTSVPIGGPQNENVKAAAEKMPYLVSANSINHHQSNYTNNQQFHIPMSLQLHQTHPLVLPQHELGGYSGPINAPTFVNNATTQISSNGPVNEYYRVGKYPHPQHTQAIQPVQIYPVGFAARQPIVYQTQPGCLISTPNNITGQNFNTTQYVPLSHVPQQSHVSFQQQPIAIAAIPNVQNDRSPESFTHSHNRLTDHFNGGFNANYKNPPAHISVFPAESNITLQQLPPPVIPLGNSVKYQKNATDTQSDMNSNINEYAHVKDPNTMIYSSTSPVTLGNNGVTSSCTYPVSSASSASSASSGSSVSSQSSPASSPLEKQFGFDHSSPPTSQNMRFWRFVDESKRDSPKAAVSANEFKEYIQIVDAETGASLNDNTTWSSKKLKYGCKECGRTFFRKSDLVRHIQIHLGIKPNVCHICGKQFIQRSALTVHVRVHTGEKPFSCNKCGRAFSDSSSLARHRRIHLRDNPSAGIRPDTQAPAVKDATG